MYKYGVLRIDNSEEARRHNERLLGPDTLGIEVTRSDLAAKCGLGNIDPQHGPNPRPDSSAIRYSLTYPLPPEGTTLVTIRPDADAFGAMAVFTVRLEGKQGFLLHELIETIHLIDCVGVTVALAKNPKILEYKLESDAMQQIVRNSSFRVEERVVAIVQILTGTMPRYLIEEIVSLRKKGDSGEFEQTVIVPDKVMLITTRGQYATARQYGTARFPVTIICDHEYVMPGAENFIPHTRWCVARRPDANIDMDRLKTELSKAEAHIRGLGMDELEKQGLLWGGPKNLASSPQGRNSELRDDEIINIVERCMKK